MRPPSPGRAHGRETEKRCRHERAVSGRHRRARSGGAGSGARAPRTPRRRRSRHPRTWRLQPADGEEKATENGASAEAEIARRLHMAVCLLDASLAREWGHKRELHRLGDGEDQAQECRQGQYRRGRGREAERRGDRGAERGDRGQQTRRLDAIDEQASVTGDGHRGTEEADPQGCDGEAGVGRLLDVQSKGNDGDPVAERRERDGARHEPKVAVSEQARPRARGARVRVLSLQGGSS
jgi:hypothetical protein